MYVYGDTCILMRTDIRVHAFRYYSTVYTVHSRRGEPRVLGPGQLTPVHTFHANAYNHRCQAYNLFSDEACKKLLSFIGLLLYAVLVCRLLL